MSPKIVPWCQSSDLREGSKSNGVVASRGFLTKFKTTNHQFKGVLQNALSRCCRKHGHAVTSTPAATPTRDSEPRVPENSSQFSPAVILMTEECAREAVIDTGASRSVIGSERVPGLVKAISNHLIGFPLRKWHQQSIFVSAIVAHSRASMLYASHGAKRAGYEWKLCRVAPRF